MDPRTEYLIAERARRRAIPNWSIAVVLGLMSAATYYYTLRAVGTTDIDAEVQKVLDEQKKSSK
jgi:hypothetical protein